MSKILLFCFLSVLAYSTGQRITTIHLDGVQYFISRMNPYSPELNYFLAYQYCRSLGLQLASFETKEKAESMTTYLKNAGYGNYDFWTSGNRLGTGMFLWMSTGLPFNATFDFFENSADAVLAGLLDPVDHNSNTSPQRTARDSSSGAEKGCVILKQPTLKWMPEDCSAVKDFICEQTRCYYYNYGSIPVSSAQGRPITSTTSRPVDAIMNFQSATTTPLPVIMSTYASFSKRGPLQDSESQPSFISLKLDHERALEVADEEAESEEHEHEEGEPEEDDHVGLSNDSYDDHARELGDTKKPPPSAADLHQAERKAMAELQQQLQHHTVAPAQQPHKDVSNAHPVQEEEEEVNDANDENMSAYIEEDAADSFPTAKSTAAPASPKADDKLTAAAAELPAVEVRLKQISQEVEKMAASGEEHHHGAAGIINHDSGDIGRQSFLSLTDLIRTLRPNDKQIIPQIDSDYSNAMRVLGETSAVINSNNDESRKFSEEDDVHHMNRALF